MLPQVIHDEPRRPALERQVPRAQRTGAFRKHAKLSAGAEAFQALLQGGLVPAAVTLVLHAGDGDAGKKKPGEPVLSESGRNHEGRPAQGAMINKAIDGPVPMQGQVERRAARRQPVAVGHGHPGEIDAQNEAIDEPVPYIVLAAHA